MKTTSVEIDFNTLKNRKSQQAFEPEVYDDIDVVSHDNRYQECGIIYCNSTSFSCTDKLHFGKNVINCIVLCKGCKKIPQHYTTQTKRH